MFVYAVQMMPVGVLRGCRCSARRPLSKTHDSVSSGSCVRNHHGVNRCPDRCAVTKRRDGQACAGNQNLEQETTEGTHTKEEPAHQRRPAKLREARTATPRPLYMHRTRTPHTYHNAPCALVTKRRNSWACRGNPNPEQETINPALYFCL